MSFDDKQPDQHKALDKPIYDHTQSPLSRLPGQSAPTESEEGQGEDQ